MLIKSKIIFSKKLAKYKNIISGTSTKAYGSMSASFGGIKKVGENRKKYLADLGIDPEDIIIAEQQHSTNIVKVTDSKKSDLIKNQTEYQNTDGFVTDKPNIFLAIFTADCVPILAYDLKKKVVGLAHAGWRGTLGLISQKLIKKMMKLYQSQPKNITVYLGPSIGPCHYQINPKKVAKYPADNRIERFTKIIPTSIITIHDKYYLDLWQANIRQLKKAGVLKNKLENSGLCTVCHNELFPSYYNEREKLKSMMMTIIGLKG